MMMMMMLCIVGAFYDPVRKEVEDIFMVELMHNLHNDSACYEAASIVALEILEDARKRAKAFEIKAVQLRKEYYEQLAAEEAERLRIEEEQRKIAEAAAKAAAELGEVEE